MKLLRLNFITIVIKYYKTIALLTEQYLSIDMSCNLEKQLFIIKKHLKLVISGFILCTF